MPAGQRSPCHACCAAPRRTALRRRRQKENQEDLLARVNQATLNMLNKNGGAGRGAAGGGGKRISDTLAYKSPAEMQQFHGLTVQVRRGRWKLLGCGWGAGQGGASGVG